MTKYTKGKSSDLEEIIDLINYTFSNAHEPHDFKTILPKIYDDKYDFSQEHYVAKEDDKIKAVVMLHKSEQRVGDTTLKIGGIGSVAVHPYSRSKGYMKELMINATKDLRETCDLGFLGGQRQRYSYFGFEPAGIQAGFSVTTTNIRHAYKDISTEGISFKKVGECDLELLRKCYSLYEREEFRGVRSFDSFYDTMISWGGSLYTAIRNDEFIGYISYNNGHIPEILLTDYDLLKPVIKGFIEEVSKRDCRFSVNLFNKNLISCLVDVCENYSIGNSNYHCFMLCNPKKVIKSYLSLKAQTNNLPDGKIVIKIGEDALDIKVKNSEVSVELTNKEPKIRFTQEEALSHLFTPLCGSIGKSVELPSFAKEWFPLPLFISSIDGC